MIKIILLIAKRIKFFKSFLERLSLAIEESKPKIQAQDLKKIAEERAQKDLERVMAYEKYGEASGYSKPIVLRVRR